MDLTATVIDHFSTLTAAAKSHIGHGATAFRFFAVRAASLIDKEADVSGQGNVIDAFAAEVLQYAHALFLTKAACAVEFSAHVDHMIGMAIDMLNDGSTLMETYEAMVVDMSVLTQRNAANYLLSAARSNDQSCAFPLLLQAPGFGDLGPGSMRRLEARERGEPPGAADVSTAGSVRDVVTGVYKTAILSHVLPIPSRMTRKLRELELALSAVPELDANDRSYLMRIASSTDDRAEADDVDVDRRTGPGLLLALAVLRRAEPLADARSNPAFKRQTAPLFQPTSCIRIPTTPASADNGIPRYSD